MEYFDKSYAWVFYLLNVFKLEINDHLVNF